MTCLKRFLGAACLLLAVVAVLTISSTAIAEGIKRGTVTGETTAKGYDHPNEYIHLNAVQVADNMEPVMPHPEQEKAARTKLAKLKKRFGKKPNILIFLIDDVGWMDPGFNGGGGAVGNPTPTMDKLAQEGLILTSAYSTPSCSPTRATIHTGQNPLHHGLLAPPMYGQPGGIAGATTLPMLLQKLGYVTQGVGKWHMGENKGSLPQNVGYDDFYGFLSVSDMYTEWRDQYFNPEIALSPARFKYMERLDFCKDNVHCTQADKDKCEAVYEIDLTSIQNLDQDWTAYSEKFIRNMKDGDKPFFLYHASRGCHFDNYPNDEYAGISPARTVYSDCMVELDNVLDRLVKTLDETGQLENTLVFFTSDNGPECEVPPHGRTPFRGCKGSSWEGGVRVPTFAYWKGMISPRRSDGIFDLADLFNTAISLAGTIGADIGKSVPQTTYIDGIDQTSFLLADDGESNRRSRIYTMNQYFTAARIDEFKFHFTVELQEAVFSRGNTGGFSGAIITETGGGLMTNLYTNPQEDVSVCVRHIPMMTPITNEIARYQAVLKKYPPQFKFGFAGNP